MKNKKGSLLIHYRETALLHASDHFGKSGCELRAATHSGDRTLAGGIVRRDYAVLDALAIFVEGSVFINSARGRVRKESKLDERCVCPPDSEARKILRSSSVGPPLPFR